MLLAVGCCCVPCVFYLVSRVMDAALKDPRTTATLQAMLYDASQVSYEPLSQGDEAVPLGSLDHEVV